MTISLQSFQLAFNLLNRPVCLVETDSTDLVGNLEFWKCLGQTGAADKPCKFLSVFPNIALNTLQTAERITFESNITGESVLWGIWFESLGGNLLLGFLEDDETRQREFHNQRLRTLGTIAGGVAHDFNNVLTGLLGHISFLKTILPTSGAHVESLSAIEDGSKKAADLTQQILSFARLKVAENQTAVDLKELIQKTTALLKGAVSARHQLEVVLPENPIPVIGAEGKLAQVLVNLVMNAKAALENSGFIRVLLDSGLDATTEDRPVAVLRVVDNGCGIPEADLSKIFEPYFSTKADGTGLGLATVDQIIKELGGTIKIKSKVDFGTTITVMFPLANIEPLHEKPAHSIKRGNEHILIVDDEDAVRNVLCVSLKHLGYSVDVASSGIEALKMVQAATHKYDLVLLDMLMPHLSGEETFNELRLVKPDLKVLLISGFASDESIKAVLDQGGMGFIQKPFTIEDLSVRVRQCLDGLEPLDEKGSAA